MRNKLKQFFNLISWVLILPLFILMSPYVWYRTMRGFGERLSIFLNFGREVIGGFRGKIKIGTNPEDILYENDNYNILTLNHEPRKQLRHLLKMRVYCFYTVDDYLFIKVFYNDKLIKKFKENK